MQRAPPQPPQQQAAQGDAAPAEQQHKQPAQQRPAAVDVDMEAFAAIAQQNLPFDERLGRLMQWVQDQLVAG